jgi:hypothetical protein
VIIAVTAVYIFPVVNSMQSARVGARFLQRQYLAESVFFEEYEENRRGLEELWRARRILSAGEVFSVLADISGKYEEFGLCNLEFSVAEASSSQKHVGAELTGDFFNLIEYIKFIGEQTNVRSFCVSDIMNETVRLRIMFSLEFF